jgi:GT2 family glycosyltransferase
MTGISFCIATAKNEKDYTFSLLKSLEDNTKLDNHEIVIFIDSDNQKTYEALLKYQKGKNNVKIHRNETGFPIGSQRNVSIMFDKATKDVVIYLQSDMVVCPDFDKHFLKALDNNKNRVISAARIEPPLHPPSPEKIVKDFGLNPTDFKYKEFCKFTKDLQKEKRPLMDGHFAPFGSFKSTYFDIMGGFDTQFRCSREDSDFIIRLKAGNVETLQTWDASVYHYTCVSSRGTDWYKDDSQAEIKNQWQSYADQEELKRFIRKWGYFGHDYRPKYDVTLFIDINTAPNLGLLASIEPYFNKIIINEEAVKDALIDLANFDSYYYANKRWGYTQEHWNSIRSKFMGPYFKDRILFNKNPKQSDFDVFVTTDMYSLIKNHKDKANQDFVTNSNIILGQLLNNEVYRGKYTIGGFEIYVNKLNDINKNHLDNKQYLFDTSEFLFK